jgi:predicted phage-related endonuclease
MEADWEMTPEIWTILGTGITLAALGFGGFTLLWRYITRAEQRTRADLVASEKRTRADLAAAEQRTRADLAAAEKRSEARFVEFKSDLTAALTAAEARNEERFGQLGTRMHTLEIQMAKLEGLLEGLREAITGKRAA